MTPAGGIGLRYGVRDGARMTPEQRARLREGLAGRTIAVVGATGAVGLETLALLAEAGVAAADVRAFASERTAGVSVPMGADSITIERAEAARIEACDAVVLAVGAGVARDLAPAIVDHGALVVDHSSAFRQDPRVPLVIPEINADAAAGVRLIASPNCTTTIALVAADPIRRRFGLRSMGVTSYQAASGAGLTALESLEQETRMALAGRAPAPGVFPVPAAFNVFPHESPVEPGARASAEEVKIARESRRIWGDPAPAVEACCLRVPVFRTHTVALRLELETPVTWPDIDSAVSGSPAIDVVEARSPAPGSLDAAGRCAVLVGRLRPADPTAPADGAHVVWSLLAAGDQLLKGAAWNGLQIAIAALAGG
ncbi:MAG: aspartate-semialdehyde dehydrogenase [Planctomycetota bacterium]|nr:MAG: aspartate-semialdehyde dehydrogenase [Planctomycetota bacterium]